LLVLLFLLFMYLVPPLLLLVVVLLLVVLLVVVVEVLLLLPSCLPWETTPSLSQACFRALCPLTKSDGSGCAVASEVGAEAAGAEVPHISQRLAALVL
jgi:hypothetical protein